MSQRQAIAYQPRIVPLGLSRAEAADYVGVSPTLFDQMVDDGRMPPAKKINARKVWSRPTLEAAFAELPDAGHNGPVSGDVWGDVSA